MVAINTGQTGDGFNRAAIVSALAESPSLSRIELTRLLGLGAATVSAQVRKLAASGYVRELPPQSTGAGRPRVPLELVRDSRCVIGLALARDHVMLVATAIDGSVLLESTAPFSPADDPAEALTALLEEPLRRLTLPCIAVGLSLSGVVDNATGRVLVSVVLDWHEVDLGSALSERLGLPVYVENDVYALATQEVARAMDGTAAEFILLTIGSGVGMAVVTDNRVFHSRGQSSTEFGHVSIDPDGPPCRCGNAGCLQTYAGLREILNGLQRASRSPVDDVAAAVRLVESGDTRSSAFLVSVGSALGRAVGGSATLLGISTVRVTGESTPLWPWLEEAFRAALAVATPTLLKPTEVVIREWAELDGATSAARLALARSLDALG